MGNLKVLLLACIWFFLFGVVLGMHGLFGLLVCALVCSIIVLTYYVLVPENGRVDYAYAGVSYGR